jgi:integrating conjugative element membrane protein (TIGR03747 family)
MASSPQEHTVAHATFAPFKFTWNLMFSLSLIWMLSIGVHIAWVNFYKLQPDTHMEQLIGFYVDKSSAKGFVEKVATGTYWLVFEATEAQRLLTIAPAAVADSDNKVALSPALRRGVGAAFKPYIQVAAYATVLFGVKLGIIALALPLLALLLTCFGIDGLVQRYIRRACGGHESAAIYHRAKLYGIKLLPPFAVVIFLSSPVAFDPAWLFIPATLFSAILLRVQATYYKKYL